MSTLRGALHALADRLAESVERIEEAATSRGSSSSAAPALQTALRALAEGDLAEAPLRALGTSPEEDAVRGAFKRVRLLVQAARTSVSLRGEGVEELRAPAERTVEGLSRQRLSLERSSEQLRRLEDRAHELGSSAEELQDAAERTSLLALNAGIEGLRVGGETARALASLGDELRRLSERAAARAKELSTGLAEVGDLSRACATAIEDARAVSSATQEDAGRVSAGLEQLRRSDATLQERSQSFRLLDDETEALVERLERAAQGLRRDIDAAKARIARPGVAPTSVEELQRALERLEATAARD